MSTRDRHLPWFRPDPPTIGLLIEAIEQGRYKPEFFRKAPINPYTLLRQSYDALQQLCGPFRRYADIGEARDLLKSIRRTLDSEPALLVDRSTIERCLSSAQILADCADDTVPYGGNVDPTLVTDLKALLERRS